MIKRKKWIFQSQRKSDNLGSAILNSLTQDISNAITSSKLKYHEHLVNKGNDPKTDPKNLLKNTENICKWY